MEYSEERLRMFEDLNGAVLYQITDRELIETDAPFYQVELAGLTDAVHSVRFTIAKEEVRQVKGTGSIKTYQIYLMHPEYLAMVLYPDQPTQTVYLSRELLLEWYRRLYPFREKHRYDLLGVPLSFIGEPNFVTRMCNITLRSSLIRPGYLISFSVPEEDVRYQAYGGILHRTLREYAHLDLRSSAYMLTYQGDNWHEMLRSVTKQMILLDAELTRRAKAARMEPERYRVWYRQQMRSEYFCAESKFDAGILLET